MAFLCDHRGLCGKMLSRESRENLTAKGAEDAKGIKSLFFAIIAGWFFAANHANQLLLSKTEYQ